MADTLFSVNRRALLAAGSMGAGLAIIPSLSKAKAPPALDAVPFRATLDSFAEEVLKLSPQAATSLGIDTGARAGRRAELDDGSAAGNARFAAAVSRMMTRLKQIDRHALSPADQLRWDTVHYALGNGQKAKPFLYASAAQGFGGGTSPYAVTQQGGAIADTPEFLDSQHPIRSSADAEAYLARVAGMTKQLNDETAQIQRSAARGVMPPDFIAKTVMGQLGGYRATKITEQKLVTSLATRTAAQGIQGDWAGRAAKLVESMVYPALDRQITAFAAATKNAPHEAGVQRLPDGDAYYAWALRLGTTTKQSPAEIHKIGRAQNEELKARIDSLLRNQGMTTGTVGQRVQALNEDPKQLFSNDEAGRAQLIAYCNGKIAAIRPLLAQLSHMGLKADVTVKRVPEDI
jgi:uncharacterized protein (DUF885 family)